MPNTSSNIDRDNFRNERYNGKVYDLDNHLPHDGMLVLDYISTRRPPQTAVALSNRQIRAIMRSLRLTAADRSTQGLLVHWMTMFTPQYQAPETTPGATPRTGMTPRTPRTGNTPRRGYWGKKKTKLSAELQGLGFKLWMSKKAREALARHRSGGRWPPVSARRLLAPPGVASTCVRFSCRLAACAVQWARCSCGLAVR